MSINADDVKELNRIIRKVDGLSGANVTNTRDAIRIGQRGRTGSRTNGPDLFPVRVVQTGGADGDGDSAATWTYDVYALTGDPADDPEEDGTLLASDVNLRNVSDGQRPNGTMIAGDNYGLAFYDGTTLVLWDAGEKEDTGTGCA